MEDNKVNNQEEVNTKHNTKQSITQTLKARARQHKRLLVVGLASVVILVIIALFVPAARDVTIGKLVNRTVVVVVKDDRTNTPISNAIVSSGDQKVKTNAYGKAVLKNVASVSQTFYISKENYDTITSTYSVPIFGTVEQQSISLHANGVPVTLRVLNAITKNPLEGVTVVSEKSTATTDAEGMAVVVRKIGETKQYVAVKEKNYLDKKILLSPAEDGPQTMDKTVLLVPEGTVQYLSKATGVINAVKSNLDGSGTKVLVRGTGNENDSSTALSSSKDWKYSALSTQANEDVSQLYVIDAGTGEKTLIDQGKVTFSVKGWSQHKLVYQIYRSNREYWQDKQQAIKVYDADSNNLQVVDESQGRYSKNSGLYSVESYDGCFSLGSEIVLVKSWSYGSRYGYDPYRKPSTKASLISVDVNSLSKKTITSFTNTTETSITARVAKPRLVYIRVQDGWDDDKKVRYYAYGNGSMQDSSGVSEAAYRNAKYTYIESPSGKKVMWFDERNGKNTVFVSKVDGSDKKTVARLSSYKPYGWYGSNDNYILVTKDDDTLYVGSVDMIGKKDYSPLELSTIHKPNNRYGGYGY